jgi:hypothetical protein
MGDRTAAPVGAHGISQRCLMRSRALMPTSIPMPVTVPGSGSCRFGTIDRLPEANPSCRLRRRLDISLIATGGLSGSSNSRWPHSLDHTADTGEGYFPVDLRGPARDHLPERMKNTGLEMVPLYAASIEDLGPNDFVKVDCAACCRRLLRSSAELRRSHTGMLAPASLARLGLEPRQRVLDLKDRVRCRRCGVRGRAVVSIKWERVPRR